MDTKKAERNVEAARVAAKYPKVSEYFCITMFKAGYKCRKNFYHHCFGYKGGCFDIDICFLEAFKKGLLINPDNYGKLEKIGKSCFVAGVKQYDKTHIKVYGTTQK